MHLAELSDWKWLASYAFIGVTVFGCGYAVLNALLPASLQSRIGFVSFRLNNSANAISASSLYGRFLLLFLGGIPLMIGIAVARGEIRLF